MNSAPEASSALVPWWARLGGLFASIATVTLVVSLMGLVFISEGDRLAVFLTWFSLSVTAFSAVIALKIFRKQTKDSSAADQKQQELLGAIREKASNAASAASEALGNTQKTLDLLEKAETRKRGKGLSVEQRMTAASAIEVAPKTGSKVLWVDDNLEWITSERDALESAGVSTVWVRNTQSALDVIEGNDFELIISDMGRREGEREGYALLDALRQRGIATPVIIYSGSRRQEHIDEVREHGGQAATNDPVELFELALRELAK